MLGTLTNISAASTVREWLQNRAELPPERSQRRWLIEQLGRQCTAEAVARGLDAHKLESLLHEAKEMLDSAWYTTAPGVATKWWRDDEEPDDEEKKTIEKSKRVLWIRHDPKTSYLEGFDSKDHFSCDKESLNFTIADYLLKPWLRHPMLDFIFVDMLVTHELCAFGESIKQNYFPLSTPRKDIFDNRYFKTKGKVSELSKVDWNAKFERWNNIFWLTIGVPVGMIWAAFHFDYLKAGWWILGTWSSLWALEIFSFVLRGVLSLFRRGPKPLTQYQSRLKLWSSMFDLWKLLEGPVLNPTRVREAMHSTTEAGAVWDNSAWAIIDSVIVRDPAVWVVTPQ